MTRCMIFRNFPEAVSVCGIAALMLTVAPVSQFDITTSAVFAQGQGNSGGSSGGQSNRGEDSGGQRSQGSSGGSGGSQSAETDDDSETGSDRQTGGTGAQNQGATSGSQTAGGSSGTTPIARPQDARTPSGSGEGPSFGDVVLDVAGVDGDDASDRPDWAGEPGGKDGAGGGQPDTSGMTKGDLFGDLFIIARDENGIPILTPEGWVQPLDADGNLIALDDEGHPVDESLTIEVELGRLNVSRAPVSVLENRADEVITLMQTATDVTTDAAGRLVFIIDGVSKTIDSPLENLAIYKALMTTGTIPGVDDLPGTEFDYLVDGQYTAEDLAASAVFLAAATDKTGVFTADEIAYINAFIGVNTETVGSVTYADIDYSDFSYDRAATYQDVTVEVLVLQDDGSWVPTVVNVYDAVFASETASDSGSLDAYTLAADDSRAVVNFVHEYEVPVEDLSSVTH